MELSDELYDFMRIRHNINPKIFNELKNNNNCDYSNTPLPVLLQPSILQEKIEQIKRYNEKNNTNYGFNMGSIFALKQIKRNKKSDIKYKTNKDGSGEFQLEESEDGINYLIDILKMIDDSANPMNKNTIMKIIEKTQLKYDSRRSTEEDPKLFLVFLPMGNNISTLQETLKKFIKKHKLWNNYHICSSNSNNKNKYMDFVDEELEKTTKNKKRGCILLLGNQGKLGITYDKCDVTIHLDNGTNIDDAKQTYYRSLTEGDDKTIGINVDLNIQRVYLYISNRIKEYKKIHKDNRSYSEILQYLYSENQFIFNPNEIGFEDSTEQMVEYFTKYEKENHLLIDTVIDNIECSDYLCDYIKQIQKDDSVMINPELNGKQQECPKGEKTKGKVDSIKNEDSPNESNDEEHYEEESNENDIISINKTKKLYEYLTKLSCLLLRKDKINAENTNKDNIELLMILKNNEVYMSLIKKKLMDNFNILEEDLNIIIDKYIKDMSTDTNQDILYDVFEIYTRSRPEDLRKIIEKHFTPSVEQKKNNAEVPTPFECVNEMIDKLPDEYFKCRGNKTFEPCCGKGNFVLAIFEKYFDGLNHITDEIERCRIIVEECMYFADLDHMNVYITKELLICHALAKLGKNTWSDWDSVLKICDFDYKCYVGNTLKLDINIEWNISRFDAIIGNPPYENIKKKGDNTLYMDFIKYSLNILKDNKFLLFITPHMSLNYFLGNKLKSCKYITKQYQLEYIDLTPKKYFKEGSTFIYFLLINNIVNDDYKYKIKSITTLGEYYKRDLKYLPYEQLSNNIINILKKLIYSDQKLHIKHMVKDSGSMQRVRKEHFEKGEVSKIFLGS